MTLHASRPVSAAKKRVENRIKVFATRDEDSPNDPNRVAFLPLFGDSTTMSMKSIKYEGKRSGCCTPQIPMQYGETSPSKRLGSAKKLLQTTVGFKMDSTFVGPIVGRSVGGKIYNGPGKNHDILGKVEKDGLVTLTGRTDDRVWLQITCGGAKTPTEGWVLASEVDLNFERKSYALHDTL